MLIKLILIICCSSLFLLLASRASANGILNKHNNNNNNNNNNNIPRGVGGNNINNNNNIKSAISDLLQGYTRPQQTTASRLAKELARSIPIAMSLVVPKEYQCAQYCSCSIVQFIERTQTGGKFERKVNLTQAKCESSQFTDLLTIDRRTQIIHISLPLKTFTKQQQTDEDSLTTTGNLDEQLPSTTGSERRSFRMPRLVQFNLLREIIIINLRFEVCDSEVFKKGQRLRRLQLNHNQLSRISKACFKHLDRLIDLNLDHNQLEELESALFNSLISLRSLSIAHNLLTELAAHQFANLTELVSLNLVGNSFKSINLQLFEPMQSSLRLLMLAKNQIKSFVHSPVQIAPNNNSNNNTVVTSGKVTPAFQGVIFRRLVKLNVDNNKIERIKLLQLHRFFNVKFLSIRNNNIAAIRDKAFNGLKLSELNLAHNQLSSITRCAFCNATVKRLVLAHNNISLLQVVGTTTSISRPLEAPVRSLLLNDTTGEQQQQSSGSAVSLAAAHNMVILSQSVVGPLFNQLEYLDVSGNERLGEQLDLLLEPLLKLEYLNLANVGLDPYLPTPNLFKNLRQLRYLNLSHNQLDQFLAESLEPLQQLELLDLSYNKFSELDESLLVVIDELPNLKLVKLSENPWYCSQCKVAPLYDWILRSPIYNQTCITPSLSSIDQQPALNSLIEKHQTTNTYNNQPQDYGLLKDENPDNEFSHEIFTSRDDFIATADDEQVNYEGNYEEPIVFTTLSEEDDSSLVETIIFMEKLGSLGGGGGGDGGDSKITYSAVDYCLRCEFPGELRSFNIHELSAGDFKFCAGAAPRFSASEPKIGLTLGIIIIGALFVLIIVVIMIYRRKSSSYYPNEFDPEQITGASNTQSGAGKRPIFSVSSDAEQRGYGDATDYSSPPMSQSSYSAGPDEDLAEEDDDELDDEDEEDEEEEEEEEEEEDEEEEDDEDEDENEDDKKEKEKENENENEKVKVEVEVEKSAKVEKEQRLSPHSNDGHINSPPQDNEKSNTKVIDSHQNEHHSHHHHHSHNQNQVVTSRKGHSAQSLSPNERSSSGPTNGNLSKSERQTRRQVSSSAGASNTPIIQHTPWQHPTTRAPSIRRGSGSRASSGSIAIDKSQQIATEQQQANLSAQKTQKKDMEVRESQQVVVNFPTPHVTTHSTQTKHTTTDQQPPTAQLEQQETNSRPHIPLSRQRFAISKDAQKSQPLGEWIANEDEDEHEMAPQREVLLSPASDATSADSLVLELDASLDGFGPASSPHGGILEAVASESSADEQDGIEGDEDAAGGGIDRSTGGWRSTSGRAGRGGRENVAIGLARTEQDLEN